MRFLEWGPAACGVPWKFRYKTTRSQGNPVVQARRKRVELNARIAMQKRWRIGLWIAGGTVLAMGAALTAISLEISRSARGLVEGWLTQEFKSKVELSSIRVAIPFPWVQVDGENLALQFQARQDLPPLIFIQRFTLRASIWGLVAASKRISLVRLEGLRISVPPHE